MARWLGVIADTHGVLRPEALAALAGAELIVHAGDVGSPGVLDGLRRLAPVVAVRGNRDKGEWGAALPADAVVEVAGVTVYVLHDLCTLDLVPAVAGFRVVVSGHTHEPRVEEQAGVLYVNPGSAGPRRGALPVSVARLYVDDERLAARVVELRVKGAT